MERVFKLTKKRRRAAGRTSGWSGVVILQFISTQGGRQDCETKRAPNTNGNDAIALIDISNAKALGTLLARVPMTIKLR